MSNRLFIEFHLIQSVPPSNINRDDTGSPKTAIFGGVRRARVSSQSWKRATRESFNDLLKDEDRGTRTKFAVDLIAEEIRNIDPDLSQDAPSLAKIALEAAGIKITTDKDNRLITGALFFIGNDQAKRLASLSVDAQTDGTAIDKKMAKTILNPKSNAAAAAIDIALFGRMVADAPDLNTDAACQVAHAISIHKTDPEFDYYTAVDDCASDETAGAGMIGTIEFTSSTLYRYATINVPLLKENLGNSTETTVRAVRAFTRAFITSMPTGKQNTFANRTLPAAVMVQLRETQPVSLVNAFEDPVDSRDDKSRVQSACVRLVAQEKALDEAFGVTPCETFVIQGSPDSEALLELGERVSLAELEDRLDSEIRSWSVQ